MRELIMIVETSGQEYRYVGNCTNPHMAPHLEDMMDQATEVSYRVLAAAVGRDKLAKVFPDYDWSARPKDMTLAREPYASYYRSTFNGAPCFYVRQSGIEFVFSAPVPESPYVAIKSQGIGADGQMVEVGQPSIFTVGVCPEFSQETGENLKAADIGQSNQATGPAAKTLMRWLADNGIEAVVEDGYIEDWKTTEEYLAWLRTVQ